MALTCSDGTAVLSGTVTVEEAEPLARWLRDTPGGVVDLAACAHVHTAALQALLAARARVAAPPEDPFLAAWVAPLLTTATDGGAASAR